MASDPSWGVRTASRIVAVMDGAIAVVMGTMQAIGDAKAERPKAEPLSRFRRASKAVAKGTKWSIAAVVGIGAVLMLGALLFVPRAKPAPSPAAPIAGSRASSRDMIERRCRAGANRSFPEIEKAECVDRPGPPSTPRGDGK